MCPKLPLKIIFQQHFYFFLLFCGWKVQWNIKKECTLKPRLMKIMNIIIESVQLTIGNLLIQRNRALHIIVSFIKRAVSSHNTDTSYFLRILQKIKKHLSESPCPGTQFDLASKLGVEGIILKLLISGKNRKLLYPE